MMTIRCGRFLAVTVVMALLVCAGGCSYLQDRGADLLDCADFGVTFTLMPTVALYYRLPVPVAGGLGGKVDGYFLGIGGGNIGFMRHYQRSYGAFLLDNPENNPDYFWRRIPIPLFVSGIEDVAYGDFDKHDPEQVRHHRMGIVGMIQGPFPEPDYFFSCPHYFHLGWIGILGNPRYNEWLDFVLGFTTLDISGDDHRPRGYWWWQPHKDFERPTETLSYTYIGRSWWARSKPTVPAGESPSPVAP